MSDNLTRLIETANAPIFGVDPEGRVMEWNAKAVALSGYSKEETMGVYGSAAGGSNYYGCL